MVTDPAKPDEEQIECAECGETLVRISDTGDKFEDYRELAGLGRHACWANLPPDADHLRLD